MSGFNLPDGVTDSMIPGNRPEDIRWDDMRDVVESEMPHGTKEGDIEDEILKRLEIEDDKMEAMIEDDADARREMNDTERDDNR